MRALKRQMGRAAGLSRNAKLFLVMTAFSSLGSGIYRLFLNLFVLARGNDRTFLGLFRSSMSLAAMGLGLPMGILADRWGRKQALLTGSMLSIIALFIFALSPLDWPLLAAAVVMGGGRALYMATGPAFMADNAGDEVRTTLFSLQSGLRMLMAFAGSAIGGLIPAWFGSLLDRPPESASAYRVTLLVAGAVMMLSLIPLLMLREHSQGLGGEADSTALSIRSFSLRGGMVRLLLPQLIIGLGAGLLIPYLNVFFKQRFEVADSLLGVVLGISQLMMGLATLLVPILARKWGSVRTVVVTELASLPFLIVLGFVPVLPIAIGAFWLRAMLMNMGTPLYSAFAMEHADEDERGKLGAMLGLTWSIGRGVSPGISGVVQQNLGFAPLFLTTGATYLVAALLLQGFFGKSSDRQ